MNKITKKITGYKIVSKEEQSAALEELKPELEVMHEGVSRPEVLRGSTYKIKNPMSEHAMYVTINDAILNEGTEYESRVPFEVFVNSKNMGDFQWVIALTRVMSAVFRKGGSCIFLVEELKSVFDPAGGYWKKGGVFMPSVVAEIGCVIERHLINIGIINPVEIDDNQKLFLSAKRSEFEALHSDNSKGDETVSFPEQSTLCHKCSVKAMVLMDGCMTCLNCGDSKCGT